MDDLIKDFAFEGWLIWGYVCWSFGVLSGMVLCALAWREDLTKSREQEVPPEPSGGQIIGYAGTRPIYREDIRKASPVGVFLKLDRYKEVLIPLAEWYVRQGSPRGPGLDDDTMPVPIWRMRQAYSVLVEAKHEPVPDK